MFRLGVAWSLCPALSMTRSSHPRCADRVIEFMCHDVFLLFEFRLVRSGWQAGRCVFARQSWSKHVSLSLCRPDISSTFCQFAGRGQGCERCYLALTKPLLDGSGAASDWIP